MRIGLLLTPGFGLLSYAMVHEVAHLLSRDGTEPHVTCQTTGLSDTVISSSGRPVQVDRLLSNTDRFDLIMVLSAVTNFSDKRVSSWLRHQARYGAAFGASTSGLWLLAQADLIGQRACTMHWADLNAFREIHPDIHVTNDLYVIEERLITSAGGFAVADMMLSFFKGRIDTARINATADAILMGRVRRPDEAQRLASATRLNTTDPLVVQAADYIQLHIRQRSIVEKVSSELGVSARWLQIQFKRQLGHTIKEFQASCRIEKAKQLLTNTTLSVSEIASVSGFSDGAHMATVFRRLTGASPGAFRSDKH